MNRIALTLAAAAAIFFAGNVSAGQPVDLHCPSGGAKVETSDGSIVLPEGTTFCVKQSNGNTGILTSDGQTTIGAYAEAAGFPYGVSYYVTYEEVSPSPSPSAASPSPSATPTSEPSPEPTPVPTVEPSVAPSTEPSATPSPVPSATPPRQNPSPLPSSETQPSPPPSASTPTTPAFTLPPTDTTATAERESDVPFMLLGVALLSAFMAALVRQGSRRRGQ